MLDPRTPTGGLTYLIGMGCYQSIPGYTPSRCSQRHPTGLAESRWWYPWQGLSTNLYS